MTALAVNTFLGYFKKFKKIMGYVNVVAGALLIIIGALVVTDYLNMISERLLSLFAK